MTDKRPLYVRQHTDHQGFSTEDAIEMKGPVVSTSIYDDVEQGSSLDYKASEIQQSKNVFRRLKEGEEWLDRKLGIETRGIDRIPEDEKQPPSILNIFFMWWSLNVHVGIIPLGLLGPQFGLSLNQSIASSVIGIMLGSLCTAYTGSLSPKLGLRQIATSRYSFGYYGAKLCSVLNVIIGGGYLVVNYVVVGQILDAVSDYHLTITVGIIIIAVVSYVVSVFGFKVIQTFERYSWLPTLVLFFVLIAQTAPHVNPNLPATVSGLSFRGAFLTIMAINFSNSSGWCSIAGDYYVNYPASTPVWKIFALTWFGIVIPTTLTVTIGSCIGNAYLNYEPWGDIYKHHYLGGLILTIYHPLGFSKFALIILTFSVLGNNIVNNYSSGLCIQLLGHYFHAVPRFLWSLLFVIVVVVLAIAGRENLSNIVADFVGLLGYWTVSFTVILLIEDKYFRRHAGYVLGDWDQPEKLPWGIAAVTALLCGYLAGGVTGMDQAWYVGPIAAYIGPHGGDMGVFLSLVFTVIWYPLARTVEKRYTGR